MNRRAAIKSIAVVAGAAPLAQLATAADKEIEILVNHWIKSKDLTLKVAEAMPAENYDYKPFADAQSFGGVLQHLAQSEGFILRRLSKSDAPAIPSKDTGKAVTMKYLTALYDWSIGVVGQLSASDLTKDFGSGKPQRTGLDTLYLAMVHTAHTRGYAEMYLRNKGIVPPAFSV